MKLATYSVEGMTTARVGVVQEDAIIDAGFNGTMIELIEDWDAQRDRLEQLSDGSNARPLSSVKLHAPIEKPAKTWAIGLNYADHIEESKMETPDKQIWFTKAQTSINPPYASILIAKGGAFVDYEAELVAIIGKRGKHIPASEAASYVFGYCVGNDVTERMWQHSGPQWSLGKSFDTHAPIGPWITTRDEIPDPHALDLTCTVNGELRQSSNTKHLVFDIWQQIEHLSGALTLEPGDVIFTGTPGGVGAAMDPRQFLKEGDVVRCDVEKLGYIEGSMVLEGQ
ncbi:fumarylacetoacetate hydrolase family protein [Hyphomonas sp. FCG-A18]|jgi:2-keto-4-pentenoate hydratase/2-oxohepta-3-ene-1,7-dioic acid hydratase in catechol pathway|uniref:fumarylacetoacetate hydrolase family protein n=1 Tax=Hyphomonas sp. FCG-A18 TaxID=3080019 RepID=UPI002B300B3C|nr:fumarylacetoacetate hydrolase family protein [Hyphomonas sp. FCG-A18]